MTKMRANPDFLGSHKNKHWHWQIEGCRWRGPLIFYIRAQKYVGLSDLLINKYIGNESSRSRIARGGDHWLGVDRIRLLVNSIDSVQVSLYLYLFINFTSSVTTLSLSHIVTWKLNKLSSRYAERVGKKDVERETERDKTIKKGWHLGHAQVNWPK